MIVWQHCGTIPLKHTTIPDITENRVNFHEKHNEIWSLLVLTLPFVSDSMASLKKNRNYR